MDAIHDEQWIKEKYEEICRQNPADYVLISLKIKRFRIFNRLFGREAGDRLLERVYEAIQGWIGEEEYAAHLYLDYYNMLVKVPHDYSTIVRYVTDFSHMIRDMKDDEGFGHVFIGLGIYPLEDDSTDFYTAQYNADVCRAECPERAYRNSHFEIYSMTYHDLNLHYFDLEQEIKPALEHGDFKLYLQPKVDLKTGEVTKAEALVRWIDPVKGMIPVSEFLPALVENGLIENVDLYLFGIVCSTVERWRQQYGKEISISVNLNECAFNYEFFFNDPLRLFHYHKLSRHVHAGPASSG